MLDKLKSMFIGMRRDTAKATDFFHIPDNRPVAPGSLCRASPIKSALRRIWFLGWLEGRSRQCGVLRNEFLTNLLYNDKSNMKH